METASSQPACIRKTNYSNRLRVCLIASVGVCCSILPSLSLKQKDSGHDLGNLTYTLVKIGYGTAIIIMTTIGFWLLRNKLKLHRQQLVFWPGRCEHCARVVGAVSSAHNRADNCALMTMGSPNKRKAGGLGRRRWSLPSSSGMGIIPDDHRVITFGRDDDRAPISGENAALHENESEITAWTRRDRGSELTSPLIYSEDHAAVPGTSEETPQIRGTGGEQCRFSRRCNTNVRYQSLYKEPHKSLLYLFNLFGIIALLNIPFQVVGIASCMSSADTSPELELIAQLFTDILYMLLLVWCMSFFSTFHDAVFLDEAWISRSIEVVFAFSIIQAALEIMHLLSNSILPDHNPVWKSCFQRLPNSFNSFLVEQDARVAPLYTELSTLAVVIVHHMWQSILPRCAVDLSHLSRDSEPEDNVLQVPSIGQEIKKLKCVMRGVRTMLCRNPELGGTSRSLQYGLLRGIAVVFICGSLALYFTLQLNIFPGSKELSESTHVYLSWCWKMAFSLPFLGLYHYQSFLTGSSRCIYLKDNISVPSGLVQGHDFILLWGSCNTFALLFLQLIASIGVLTESASRRQEEIVLASFGVIFSINQFYTISCMTEFLLTIQRRKIRSLAERKWVLISLVLLIILNLSNWIVEITLREHWKQLEDYFADPIGKVLGTLLQPMVSLWNLHVVIIAYQTRQIILGEGTNLEHQESIVHEDV